MSLGGLACQPVALGTGLTWDGRVRSVSWGPLENRACLARVISAQQG